MLNRPVVSGRKAVTPRVDCMMGAERFRGGRGQWPGSRYPSGVDDGRGKAPKHTALRTSVGGDMNDARTVRTHPARIAILVVLSGVATLQIVEAQGVQPPGEAKAPPLPRAPAPLGVPKPAAATDGPYAPQPILPGG